MENSEHLAHIRHTLAHLLAQAVLEHYPSALLTLGPAVDNGFYYDIDFGTDKVSDEDLGKISKTMVKNLSKWTEFTHKEVSKGEALKSFAGNIYKAELINEIAERGEKITLYTCGGFTDLCRGGHTEHPNKDISPDSFVLDRIAGAYWRGSEDNKMLTRIYGLAFETKKDLNAYKIQQEEARKRDHRKLGRELDLFTFSDLVGVGMPLFTPRGNIVREQIIGFSRELNDSLGFGEVHTPNINKAELFKISGHYDKYKEDMLSVRSQYVSDEMFLKPMNCPQHTQIYASAPRSYRDLPIRYSDFAVLYRDERPGEMSGLTRLRSFSQDDGHIFCRPDQVEEEIGSVLGAIQKALEVYKIDSWMRLSLRDPNNKEKYLGDDETWEKSQAIMKSLLKEKNIAHKEAIGEAAFYGPKIDIMAVDAIGREWQISTIQLDFNQPARFELVYTDSDGKQKTPVMIHRALIGSPDRFLGILTEHYAGAFPTWLSPVQVSIIPVREEHEDEAEKIYAKLKSESIRVEKISGNESLGKRIHKAKDFNVPYVIIFGDKEKESGVLTIEKRDGSKIEVSLDDFIAHIKEETKNRS
ncbi:MAG: threonine--tRNA ligase [Patescibacteria group bacterium]